MVAESCSILNNWAQFIVLCGVPGGDIGFINVYAPNDSIEKIQLMEELMTTLPPNCRWIIVGNFNFVESR